MSEDEEFVVVDKRAGGEVEGLMYVVRCMAGQEQPTYVMSLLFAANYFRTHASAPSCDHDSEQRPTSAFTVAHHSLVHACSALRRGAEMHLQQRGQTRIPIRVSIRNRRSADQKYTTAAVHFTCDYLRLVPLF